MEEKMKRESRKCLETLFKKNDKLGSGSISVEAMRDIMHAIMDNFIYEEELEAVMTQYVQQENSIDFPSALAIAVHFLKKLERRQSDAFAGKGLIRFGDLPTSEALQVKRLIDSKRRLY